MDFYQEFENKARIKKYEKIISIINDYYDEYAQICNAKYSTSKIANRCIEEGTDVLRYYLTDFYDTKMNEEDERFLGVIEDINNIDKNTKFLKSVNTVFDYVLSKLGKDTTFISKSGLEDKANYLLTNIDEIKDDKDIKAQLLILGAGAVPELNDIMQKTIIPLVKSKKVSSKNPMDSVKEAMEYADIDIDVANVIDSFRKMQTKMNNLYTIFNDELKDKLIKNTFIAETNSLKRKIAKELDAGRDVDKVLEEILPQAYGLVKAMCEYVKKIKPYDVQLMGAIAINDGNVAEMYTGEGKTITAILPAYLNALTGKEVDIFTPNDYLAQRDAASNKDIFNALGLSVGCTLVDGQDTKQKKKAYNSDIVYGSSTAFAFDYLYDTNEKDPDNIVQRREKPGFVIVDEADQVLIDNAISPYMLKNDGDVLSRREAFENKQIKYYLELGRTLEQILSKNKFEAPNQYVYECLIGANKEKTAEYNNKYSIIVGPHETSLTELGERQLFYYSMKGEISKLSTQLKDFFINNSNYSEDQDYVIKNEQLLLTLPGLEKACRDNPDFADINMRWLTEEKYQVIRKYVSNAITAKYHMEKGKDYQIRFNPKTAREEVVVLQDGRIMENSKFTNGLHQAIEIKEGLGVILDNNERLLDNTLASITNRTLLSRYDKISGMTGTADKSAFSEIYGMETCEIPRNMDYQYSKGRTNKKPHKRVDHPTKLYRDNEEKLTAVLSDIISSNEKGQPVLVVTDNDEQAKYLYDVIDNLEILDKKDANLLIAGKDLEEESKIIANAGKKRAITIASEMAGRGTDIKLGGNGIKSKKQIEELYELGGLKCIQLNPFETTRNDNQLRGRVGRQGEPGETITYASLDDLKNIGVDKQELEELSGMIRDENGIDDSHDKVDGRISEIIEDAQLRKEFDEDLTIASNDTMDFAMSSIGTMLLRNRKQLLATDDVSIALDNMVNCVIRDTLKNNVPPKKQKKIDKDRTKLKRVKIDMNKTITDLSDVFGIAVKESDILECETVADLKGSIKKLVDEKTNDTKLAMGDDKFNNRVKSTMLREVTNTYNNFIYSSEQITLQAFNDQLAQNTSHDRSLELNNIYNDCKKTGWVNIMQSIYTPNLRKETPELSDSEYMTEFDYEKENKSKIK